MARAIYTVVVLMALVTCAACSTPRPNGEDLRRVVATAGPVVRVSSSVLALNQDEACRLVQASKLTDLATGAILAGMRSVDFEAIKNVTGQQRIIATFRDSNQACLPHLDAGIQSKPHSILQKTWDRSNLLAQDEAKAGLVSNQLKKPPKGEKIADPQLVLHNGEPVTCDYDLMDLAEESGERIPGESSRELAIRRDYNKAIPLTVQGHRDRIMHGSQSGYGRYIQMHEEEPVIVGLFKPEVPLTAFDNSGAVFRLETLEQVLGFYRCKMIPIPSEWHLEPDETAKGNP